jgi:putative sterol carrier protein
VAADDSFYFGWAVERIQHRKEALARHREDPIAPVDPELVDEDLSAGAWGHAAVSSELCAMRHVLRRLACHPRRGPAPVFFAANSSRLMRLHAAATLTDKGESMTKQELVERMQQGQAWVPGKRVKIDFGGSEGVAMLDGAAQQVTEDDGPADTTIRVGWDDWQQMAAGQLDGMTAFMMGKLKVEGDMSNAMQLQGVLAKLKG